MALARRFVIQWVLHEDQNNYWPLVKKLVIIWSYFKLSIVTTFFKKYHACECNENWIMGKDGETCERNCAEDNGTCSHFCVSYDQFNPVTFTIYREIEKSLTKCQPLLSLGSWRLRLPWVFLPWRRWSKLPQKLYSTKWRLLALL